MPKLLNTPTLPERIAAVQAECDKFVDSLVEREKQIAPGVPVQMIRDMMTRRYGPCPCEQYTQLKAKELAEKEAAEAREAAAALEASAKAAAAEPVAEPA